MPLFDDLFPSDYDVPVQSHVTPQGNLALNQMTPAEADTTLQKLLRGTMGGVQTLSKGLGFAGRAVRGGLAGKPRELLNILPLPTDMLGITNPEQETSGEDLAKQWGLLEGEGTKGEFEARDLVGPAIEFFTDPLTYATGVGSRALSSGGKIAEKLGALPKVGSARMATTLEDVLKAQPHLAPAANDLAAKAGVSVADIMKQPLGGLARFGIPFTDSGALLGTGATAQKFSNLLGRGADWATYTRPGRYLSALFDPRVEGTTGEGIQRALRDVSDKVKSANVQGEQVALNAYRQLADAGELTPDISEVMRDIREGVRTAPPGSTLEKVMGELGAVFDQMPGRESSYGVESKFHPNYMPRGLTNPEEVLGIAGGRGSHQALNPMNPNLVGREELLDPLATSLINKMGNDVRLRGANRTFAQAGKTDLLQEANALRRDYLGVTAADEAERFALNQRFNAQGLPNVKPLTQQELDRIKDLDAVWKRSEHLADWLSGLGGPPNDIFGNSVFKDIASRVSRGVRTEAKAEAIHSALARGAQEAASAPLDWVPVSEVFRKAGLTNQATVDAKFQQVLKDLNPQLLGKVAGDLRVSPEMAKDLTRYVTAFTTPDSLKPFITGLDTVTALTKLGQTATWPAKYTRDFVQGLFQNFVRLDPANWMKSQTDAWKLLRNGEVLADANKIRGFEHLSPEQASKKISDLFTSYNGFMLSPNRRSTEEVGEHAFQQMLRPLPGPGNKEESLGTILKGAIPTSKAEANPLAVAGIGGRKGTDFAPVRAGAKTMDWIEDVNRGALFLGKLREGFSPEQAMEKVIQAHYDFSNLSPFEKSVMKRVLPYYSWMRQNLPATINELVTNPGGGTAQAVKATNQVRQQQGFVPEYLGEGLAIPLGAEDETGTRRYLSKLGLNFEDVMPGLGHGPMRTLEELVGQTNPLLKVPLELAAGKQFQTGRRLEDLYPFPTGNVVADELLENSPIGRLLNTTRTFMDERKGLGAKAFNFFGPGRITDVDLNKQRPIAGADLIQEALQGDRNVGRFESLYPRKEAIPTLSPRELELLRLNAALEQQRRAAAKKPKAAVVD